MAMFKVGLYKNMEVRSPNVVIDLRKILDGIRDGQWKDVVTKYRKTGNQRIKDSLPCYTAGGVWGSSKAISNIISPSNLISLDIDDFEGGLDKLMSYLEILGSSLYHISKSCGEKGYCVLIYHKEYTDYEHYKKIYHAIYTELEETGLGKVSKFDYLQNLNRLRYVSYDPHSITFDEEGLVPYTKELDIPVNVEIKDKGELVKKFVVGGQLSDSEKFEVVLSNYVESVGDFGSQGTRHDWILGIARWCCRADVDETFLTGHLLANYQNPSRPQVWSTEVKRCVRDSYRAYSAERGSFEVTKKFDYKDILSATNVEEIKLQLYLLIADKLNYAEHLTSQGKNDTYIKNEVLFLKKITEYL